MSETGEGPKDSLANFTMNRQAQQIAALELRNAELTARVAELEATVAEKQNTIEYACRDWADDDTRVKEIAAQFGIKECHDNHDAFKGVIEIAEEMAALLTEARKDGQWRDIATAPKDGTRILIYSKECGVHEGKWHFAPHWLGCRGFAVFGLYDASLWMPLPAMPLPEKEASA